MNYSINSKEFLKAINIAGKAIAATAMTSIYECILIDVDESGLMTITGSDGNIVIQSQVQANEFDLEGTNGKMAVPYVLLAQTLTNLPNSPITITHFQDSPVHFRAELVFETDLFKIPCEDPTTYFKVPNLIDAESFPVNAGIFSNAIDGLIQFVSEDDLRPSMKGVNMKFNAGQVEFCATNGFVLAIYKADNEGSIKDKSIILPTKFGKIVFDLVTDYETKVEFEVSDRYIKAEVSGVTVYSTLIEERYPDYENAIPTDFAYDASIDADALKMAVKRAASFGDPKTNSAKLRFVENNLFFTVEDVNKNTKCDQDIAIQSEIEDFTIGFNTKFLGKILSKVNGVFQLSLVAPNRGAMIYPKCGDNEELKYLIMPVAV